MILYKISDWHLGCLLSSSRTGFRHLRARIDRRRHTRRSKASVLGCSHIVPDSISLPFHRSLVASLVASPVASLSTILGYIEATRLIPLLKFRIRAPLCPYFGCEILRD